MIKWIKYIILFVALFFPLKHFLPYHLLLTALGLAILMQVSKISFNLSSRIIFVFFVILLITSMFRTYYLGINIRDYMEIFRFVPLFLFTLVNRKLIIPFKHICVVLFFYVGLDTLLSILQITNLNLVSGITKIYTSELHYENSLTLAKRAIGLSRGPGDHGAIMTLMTIFFFTTYFYEKNKYVLLGFILACISTVISQSQTAFIASLAGLFAVTMYFFLFGQRNQRKLSRKAIVWFGLTGFIFITYFFQDLRYLASLIEVGTERSAYQLRLEKADFVQQEIINNPHLSVIGFGKHYWGDLSSGMDNEYVYVYSVYGVIVFFAALAIVVFVLLRGFIYNSFLKNKAILFIILVGLIIAYPSAFFTEPRIIILIYFINLSINEDSLKFLVSSRNLDYQGDYYGIKP